MGTLDLLGLLKHRGVDQIFIPSKPFRLKYRDAAQAPKLARTGEGGNQEAVFWCRRLVSYIAISAEHIPIVRVKQARRDIRTSFRTNRQRPLVFARKKAKASQLFDKERVAQI